MNQSYQQIASDRDLNLSKLLVKIPTEEQHKRRIRTLWWSCIAAAIAIFVILGIVVGCLFVKGYDSKKIVEVSTAIFQILVLSYGMGFFVPAFVTSLLNMWLGVQMSRIGIDLGTRTANILTTLDQQIQPRLASIDLVVQKADKIFTQASAFLGTSDNPTDHPLVQKLDKALLDFKAEAGKLQGEVGKLANAFSRPLVVPPEARELPKPKEKPGAEPVLASRRNGKDDSAA